MRRAGTPPNATTGSATAGQRRTSTVSAPAKPMDPARKRSKTLPTNDPVDVLTDSRHAIQRGRAMKLAICDSYYCSTPCLGFPAGSNCVVDPFANPPVWGNPMCETEACRKEGQCIPRSVCVELGDCALDSDAATSPPVDGGTLPAADAPASDTPAPVAQDSGASPPVDAPAPDATGPPPRTDPSPTLSPTMRGAPTRDRPGLAPSAPCA